MTSLRRSRALVVGALLASVSPVALEGCGRSLENPFTTHPVPTGEPPPAGFATEMVDAHNAVRANATPSPSPALPALMWNTEVAATAQAWADGCHYQHNAGRGQLGENIAATAPPGAYDAATVVGTATSGLWASEAQDYTYSTNSCATGRQCGHYTQIVWRDTSVVGCGVQTCTAATWPFQGGTPGAWQFWVCDYAPAGNIVGQRPY